MQLINIREPQQKVSFKQAVLKPLGKEKGLFFPNKLPKLAKEVFYQVDFHELSYQILSAMIGNEILENDLKLMIKKAFNFPLKLEEIDQNTSVLELFHGPTFAFKDFGARFLAQCLSHFNQQQKVTIVAATSGDTGAAVAHAFYDIDNIDVVILYPHNKISKEQEQLFCSLGKNIKTIAIKADFDACQTMVKEAFSDNDIKKKHNLSSANSINIARLLAQVCYYSFLPNMAKCPIDLISVPSGNFGNLTAGLIAKQIGAPIGSFIAATNSNDTIPRYLQSGNWNPKATIATLSNAMDVAIPNNFPRIEYLFSINRSQLAQEIQAIAINEKETIGSMRELLKLGYLSDPHTAVAYSALKQAQTNNQYGICLSTAHPAKFRDVIRSKIGKKIPLPSVMETAMHKENLSMTMENNFEIFKNYLLSI